jgi:hypothetical protein
LKKFVLALPKTLVVLAMLVVAMGVSSSAEAAKSKPCIIANPAGYIVKSVSKKCLNRILGRYLDCWEAAYDRDGSAAALDPFTCESKRWAYQNALISARLPRKEKRNRLIDLAGSLEDDCYRSSAHCSDLREVEREIRKLAA